MEARLFLSKKVRKIRQKLGLSQEQLADKAGLHRTYIGSIERGERNVTIDVIEKISIALEIPVYFLFMEDEIEK